MPSQSYLELYEIGKEFKRGIIARIEHSDCDWNEKSQAFIHGWSWMNKNIHLVYDPTNEYMEYREKLIHSISPALNIP